MDDPGFKSLVFLNSPHEMRLWMSLDSGDLVHLCELE